MRRFTLALVFLIGMLGIYGTASAQLPHKVMKLEELVPGTKAVGFSVFKGAEPQPFDVVLGEAVGNFDSYLI
ncbi:MAG: hypothetical protein AAB799_01795, partial [Patescibacteria group bacterium]